jgi:hypothetical protein
VNVEALPCIVMPTTVIKRRDGTVVRFQTKPKKKGNMAALKRKSPAVWARAQATKEVAAALRKQGSKFNMSNKTHQAMIKRRAAQLLR